MNTLDSHTLVVAAALLSAVMFLTMFAMYLSAKSERALVHWSFAGAFTLLGNVMSPTIGVFADWVIIGVSNAFFLLAHVSVLTGLLVHLGKMLNLKLIAVLLITFFLLHSLPLFYQHLSNRILLFAVVVSALKLITISLLIKAFREERQLAYFPLMLVEAFFILQLLVRSYPIVTADVSNITRLSSHWVESLGWLSDLLYISVVTLSCALIIIRKQVMKIDKLSKTDSLSECLNRHALKQLVPLSLQDAVSSNKHFALIMFDIDHFKNINDSYGHAIGDEAIKSVVASAKSCIRKSDHIFRLGGEEFLVVTLSDSLEASSQLAERIREKVEGALLQVENKTIRFTISLGVAEALSDEENWEQIMNRADEALYSAKQSGRNKVAVATSV